MPGKRKLSFIFSDKIKFMPFSWAIKFYTGEKYSHVAIGYFDSTTSQEMLAESSNGEFHKITRENWLKKNKVVYEYEIEIDEDIYYTIMRHINNHLQLDYSFLNIAGIPFYDLYELTGIRLFYKIACLFKDGTGAVICSESVAFTLAILGIQFKRPFDFLRPDHIFTAVLEYKANYGKDFYHF
jgi:hypothetical protein